MDGPGYAENVATAADTIVALSTPRGVSALAVVRASGPACAGLAEAIFGVTPPPRMATHADYRRLDGTVLDDVVCTFFVGPRSYTGEDSLEISCHGNPLIVHLMLEDLVRRGARLAEPGEFTRRAFLGGQFDLAQAEAVLDVIHAQSERALTVARRQLAGGLGRLMEELITQLVAVLARVEAYIDFPEEDLPPEDVRMVGDAVANVLRGTDRLLATRRYGDLLRDGIRVAIVGEPNAGKSSLLNRLVGRDRALVSPEPGTTRDYLEERIILEGNVLRMIDTAGLNASPGVVEAQGIAKSIEQAVEADLVLWMIDATTLPQPAALPGTVRSLLTAENCLLVANKADLLAGWTAGAGQDVFTLPGGTRAVVGDLPCVWVSALNGWGWEVLQAELGGLAGRLMPRGGEDEVAINARHSEALHAARDSLVAAQSKLAGGAVAELLASDLREALHACGEIAGRVDHERVLDHLFATFCIGK